MEGFNLIQAIEYVQNIQIHRAACRNLLDLVVDNHTQFSGQDEWPRLVKEICESFKLWSELDELERLMQCDNIPGTLSLMRLRIAQFGIDCPEEPTPNHSGARVHTDLVPAVLSLLSTPDGLDRMECLPPSSLHKAMALLQRVLNTISPASPHYLEVHTALMRLQRADTTANLEAPDLTPHISCISDEPFAKGGFSDVYTGEWLRQGRVALKILRILGGSGASRRHRLFRKEVKLWHGLRHPHLLQFWGLCNTAQGLAMVSPFLPDGNAAAYLSAHPDASALSLLVGSAYGLEYLHTRQPPITHGDLRGANILVSPGGEACLADFGLSKIMEVASGDSSHGTTTANAGATRWMAPELFHADSSEYPPSCSSPIPGGALEFSNGISANRESTESNRLSEERDRFEGVTPRSDVWAYGMTIYELMTGKVPYPRIKNSATVMLAILRGERPSKPVTTRGDWTPALFDLMQDCWSTRPSSRPTMSQVSERMRSLRDASRAKSPVPHSLLLAIDTPLQPVSPTAWGPVEEEHVDIRETSFIYESPIAEVVHESHFPEQAHHRDSGFQLSIAPRKQSTRRKSTAEESTLARTEADDALAALPVLSPKGNVGRTLEARPRSSSAPMTVPTHFSLKGLPQQPSPAVYQSQNSSLISLASASNQSRFSKPSRPATPATPVPEEPPSSPPVSPVIRKRQRMSSFWKKNSLERMPVELTTGEGSPDPLKIVMPILQGLIAGEEVMLEDNFDASFSSSLRKAGPEVVPLERIDQLLTQLLGGYVRLRKQHRIFLQALRSAENMTAEEIVPTLCSLLSGTIQSFDSVYPKYAFDIYQMEELLSEEMECNFPFRAWLQEPDEVKLRKFLQKPLTSIETIFVSLSQWIAFAKLKSSKDTLMTLRDFEHQLVGLLMRVRLGRWQGAMGQDEIVYNWRQLVSFGNTEAFADEERQSAIFKVIRTQGSSVRMMQSFHQGVLKRIVLAPSLALPNLNRLYTQLSSLIEINSQLLNQLHKHQMQSHPRLTNATCLVYDSITSWADVYSLYSAALVEALEELEDHSAGIFPIVHVISHPILKTHDLPSLLWLPINHLRHLSKSFYNLLDATSDAHEDLKATVEVVSTLGKLIELCDSWTASVGTGTELRQLETRLQWTGDEDHSLELDRPERRVIHNGRLLMPQRDSDSFLDLFVVLLDNSLIITHPRMRWGLSTLQVYHTMLLEDMSILDLDSVDDLYLLDASHGETIAAPLPIRYETSTVQKSLTLLCSTTLEAIEWRRHITAAKVGREGSMEAFPKNIFERGGLITTVSFTPSCSAEFELRGTKYFVIGGQNSAGLWIRAADQRALRQLLTGVSIRQCTVVPSLELLLVLSGKSLISFKLEDLVLAKVTSRQVDAKGSVVFFRIGSFKQSLLLIVAVASGQSSSFTVRIYEAGSSTTNKTRRSSLFGIREQWSTLFKQVAEIPILHQLFDCAIMDDVLFLMGSGGFIRLDNDNSWSTFRTLTYPVFKGLASSQTYHRCKTSKPINVHGHGDLFMLCYADFGIYVNHQGLVQGQCVDWVSERVTQAFFGPPHVFLASRDMIEARLIQTGRIIDRVEIENARVTLETPRTAKKSTDKVIHIATIERQSLRGFEVPTIEPCSIHQWSILASK